MFGDTADRLRQEAIDWHLRLHSGEADASEQARFAAWRALSPEHAATYERIDALWASDEMTVALEDLLPRNTAARPAQARRPIQQWGWAVAASVIVLGLVMWQGPELLLRSQADFLTERGIVQSFALPDGSTLTLNTETAVAVDFTQGRRHVALLRGEAYFDVAKDAAHPFTVTGLASEVEVTGTAFSLAARAGEDRLTVAEGHVLFQSKGAAHAVEVLAGQAAAAGAATEPVADAADVSRALSWRDGRVVISALPLWRALDELQRYRAAPVVLANLDRRDMLVTGDFRIGDIEGAVLTLATVAGLSTTTLPGSIIFVH